MSTDTILIIFLIIIGISLMIPIYITCFFRYEMENDHDNYTVVV
jgi:hypothetical protein